MQTDFKDLSRICNNIERVIRLIPHKAAVLAVNFSKERFVKKNWIDTSEQTWKKTKKRKGSTLIKSGRLKRSIRKVHIGADYAIIVPTSLMRAFTIMEKQLKAQNLYVPMNVVPTNVKHILVQVNESKPHKCALMLSKAINGSINVHSFSVGFSENPSISPNS